MKVVHLARELLWTSSPNGEKLDGMQDWTPSKPGPQYDVEVPSARTGVYTLENKKWQYACGLRGARSFEEGAMWHGG
jgi:hypothetical protein